MNLSRNLAIPFLFGIFLLTASTAKAEEVGKDLHAKVEAIIVNLQGPAPKYVQVELLLKLSRPELTEKIKLYMPIIRNKMILIISNKTAGELEAIEGKQKLAHELKDAINQGLELTEKAGVTDVLFSSFIMQ